VVELAGRVAVEGDAVAGSEARCREVSGFWEIGVHEEGEGEPQRGRLGDGYQGLVEGAERFVEGECLAAFAVRAASAAVDGDGSAEVGARACKKGDMCQRRPRLDSS
jgi:hypothetical protein